MNLVKTVRSAVDSNNVILGTKGTLERILIGEGIKLVVVASNCERRAKGDLKRFAELSGVELIEFDGSSVELGEVSGKPFVVSMLTILEDKKSDKPPKKGKK